MNINHKNIYNQSIRDRKDQIIKSNIEDTFVTHPAYGHRRLAFELRMNHKKVLRIMHKFNLTPPRLWYQKKYTTQSDPGYLIQYTNILKDMDLSTLKINDVWSSDLTYIKHQGKFIYLSIIQDIVSKEVVGFNLSFNHDSKLVLKTIKEAVIKAGGFPNIFHCDRGRENLSQICTSYLEENKTKISVSDPGSPWQNGWSESFFSRFKQESGDLNRFETLGELIEYIFGYLNYYNRIRIHTKIKMSPYQFKLKVTESGLEKRGTWQSVIDEVLVLTQNIVKTYDKADIDHKRAYLHFFFQKILVKDKKIVEVEYTPALQVLNEAKLGILSANWLPNPEILRATIDKLLRAFENVTQTEFLKIRWQLIILYQKSVLSLNH